MYISATSPWMSHGLNVTINGDRVWFDLIRSNRDRDLCLMSRSCCVLLALPCSALQCLAVPCHALPCPALPFPALPCLTLGPALPYHTLYSLRVGRELLCNTKWLLSTFAFPSFQLPVWATCLTVYMLCDRFWYVCSYMYLGRQWQMWICRSLSHSHFLAYVCAIGR